MYVLEHGTLDWDILARACDYHALCRTMKAVKLCKNVRKIVFFIMVLGGRCDRSRNRILSRRSFDFVTLKLDEIDLKSAFCMSRQFFASFTCLSVI